MIESEGVVYELSQVSSMAGSAADLMKESLKRFLLTCAIVMAVAMTFALATVIHWNEPQNPTQRAQVAQGIDQTPLD